MRISSDLLAERAARRAENPLKYAKYHHGERLWMQDRHAIVAVVGGNWSAKTTWIAMTLAGAATGQYPFPGVFPEPPLPIICLGDPKIFQGKIQPIALSYMPPGFVTGATMVTPWRAHSFWECANGSTVRFHSFDSDVVEGVEYALLLSDEPPPERLLNSLKSRLRNDKMMKLHGFGAMQRFGFTPLMASAYLYDQFGPDYDRETTAIYKVPIWVNCTCLAGLEVERLKRFNFDVRLADETHPPDCKCNGGFKTQAEIKSYLRMVAPMEVKWRESGDWMLVERCRFPMFVDADPYVFDPLTKAGWRNGLPPNGTLYVGCDPHSSRPDAITMGLVLPNRHIAWIDELPDFNDGPFKGVKFDDIENYYRPTSIVVKELVRKIKAILSPTRTMGKMVMDPFRGSQHTGDHGEMTVEIFNAELRKEWPDGPRFMIAAPDKDDGYSVEAGERKINDLLYYDQSQPVGISNCPAWTFSSLIKNTIRAILNHRVKADNAKDDEARTEKSTTGFKDFIDPMRYVLMTRPRFIPPSPAAEASVWGNNRAPVVAPSTGMV